MRFAADTTFLTAELTPSNQSSPIHHLWVHLQLVWDFTLIISQGGFGRAVFAGWRSAGFLKLPGATIPLHVTRALPSNSVEGSLRTAHGCV